MPSISALNRCSAKCLCLPRDNDRFIMKCEITGPLCLFGVGITETVKCGALSACVATIKFIEFTFNSEPFMKFELIVIFKMRYLRDRWACLCDLSVELYLII